METLRFDWRRPHISQLRVIFVFLHILVRIQYTEVSRAGHARLVHTNHFVRKSWERLAHTMISQKVLSNTKGHSLVMYWCTWGVILCTAVCRWR